MTPAVVGWARAREAVQAPPPDLAGVAGVLTATVVAAWHLLRGSTIAGLDALSFFYPMYALLGERLASGDLPGWNPHQLAGAPLLADPQSGWGYLPVMLLFTILPLAEAARTLLLFHLLLAGLATYALARVVGLGAGGALVAAIGYQHAWPIAQRGACCIVHTDVAAWLPALLLGAELAIRARSWPKRLVWWGAAGVALSQIMAGWLGQGTYYAALVLGGYVAIRVLLAGSFTSPRAILGRIGAGAGHLAAIAAWGGAMAAAGLLPRLDYNERTLLAGGVYRGAAAQEARIGGWDADETIRQLLTREVHYAGGAVLALALLAWLARGRWATPAFAAVAVALLLLLGPATDPTPLQSLLSHLLPRFESINFHWPNRALVVLPLALALLAGAAVHALPDWLHGSRRLVLLIAAAMPPLALLLIERREIVVPRSTLWMVVGVSALVGIAAVTPAIVGRRVAPVALALLVLLDLHGANHAFMTPARSFPQVNLAEFYAAGGAGQWLQRRSAGLAPFRFFGYDPGIWQPNNPAAPLPLYRYFYTDPRTSDLIVNNRASILGLADVQGYNPIQNLRTIEYFAALNGFQQEYREANIYASGLASPLLDLLNARYAVVPTMIPSDRVEASPPMPAWPEVWSDERTRILENPQALPRAWIVHEAQRVNPGEALPLLAGGTVDPRRVALLETDPPALAPVADPAADEATVVADDGDSVRLRVRSEAAGLLVLSEVFDPGWSATVDGESTPILVADHLLRAVPIPAGEHRVMLRYEPPWLRVGLAVSGVALLLWLAVIAWVSGHLALWRVVSGWPRRSPGRVNGRDPSIDDGKR